MIILYVALSFGTWLRWGTVEAQLKLLLLRDNLTWFFGFVNCSYTELIPNFGRRVFVLLVLNQLMVAVS